MPQPPKLPHPISRRIFLRLALSSILVAGCDARRVMAPTQARDTVQPAETDPPAPTRITQTPPTATSVPASTDAPPTAHVTPTESPTFAPSATPPTTPAPTVTLAAATPTSTSAKVSSSRHQVMRTFPEVKSRVVRVHQPGVVSDDVSRVDGDAVAQMLDTAIQRLVGIDDVVEAWSLLFDPEERVAIKVNTISGARFWTHRELVDAVVDRLLTVGVPGEHIVIFDRLSRELESAGYPVRTKGAGARSRGTDGSYSGDYALMGQPIALSDILLACDALINIPLLKQHGISGISFSMKNHYGSFDKPGHYHGKKIGPGIAELNALDPIRNRTRLILGDALTICTKDWNSAVPGNTLLASFDPVAHDALGLEVFSQFAREDGGNEAAARGLSKSWLSASADLGLGTPEMSNIDLVEVELI